MEAALPNEVVPIRAQVFDDDIKPLRPLNCHRDNNTTKVTTTPSITAAETIATTTAATVTAKALTNSGGSTMKLSADAATFFPKSRLEEQDQHQHQLQEHYPQQPPLVESQTSNYRSGNCTSERIQQQKQIMHQISYGGANANNSTYLQMQHHSSQAQPLYHHHRYHQQQQFQRNSGIHMGKRSVQDRLKIHNIESNNYHQQQYQQQQLNNNNNYHNPFHNHTQQYQYVNTNNQHGGYHGGGGAGFRPQNQGLDYQEQQQLHNRNQYQQHVSNKSVGQVSVSVAPQQAAAAVAAETTNDMDSIALDYLQTVIQCLSQNPGQFDSIASRFITIFDGMENNFYVLSIAMEEIFEESIAKPNFRYMGAKLYNLLYMLNTQPDSLFHTLLNRKLNFYQSELQKFVENNEHNKVRETALFLAELYMQLRTDESRIQLIAQNIVYSLKQLLLTENMDNIRCICLTLKLAGYDLTVDCPNDMNDIIECLERINRQSPNKYLLVANVIALQKNNWGRKVSRSESPITEGKPNDGNTQNQDHKLKHDEQIKPPVRLSNDPVFYGPDGHEITEEECEFLTTNANEANNEEDDDDNAPDSDIDFDLEMEEEHEHDYKEFIKQSKKSP